MFEADRRGFLAATTAGLGGLLATSGRTLAGTEAADSSFGAPLRNGVDIADLRARQVRPADFRDFTHKFALYWRNLKICCPSDGSAKLHLLLLDWVEGRAEHPVANSYFGVKDGFAQTWADMAQAADAILARLTK